MSKRRPHMNNPVVIVDCECMTAAGINLAATWKTLLENGSGIRAIDRFNTAEQPLQGVSSIAYAGQIPMSYEELAGSPEKFQKWSEPGFHAVQRITESIVS